ncbi:hypothetical protein [Pseudorhodoferax sp. Leaf265]|uniref:hypothetical protein n=1 Tax=Pseudorhodoferax sp. Leaf265 TaxID=1736315 RepID=UPI000AB9AD4A|nr:hypothetical protein [Pseudorhodoferax sp. Leaf265]
MNPRARAIRQMTERLSRDAFPRLQMALIVALTGGFGLLASFVLLRLGLDAMALRYPLALCCAYGFFLFLVWLWLRTNAADYVDLVDVPGPLPRLPERMPGFQSGGGGDFGGGGASAAFDSASVDASPMGPLGNAASTAAEGDELAIPLLAIVLAVGLALASLYVVYIAPVLFAEVLVDGALSYALFRHLRGQDPAHWLSTTVRRTVLPFAATAVFVALVGVAMTAYAPGARSIGEVLEHAARR